jgi:nicotinate-nucleotide pyrophosphorylase (carboxylating)
VTNFPIPQFQTKVEAGSPLAHLELDETMLAAIRQALSEDIGSGDVTTDSIVPSAARARAQVIAKQDGVLSGLSIAQAVFLMLSDQTRCSSNLTDGSLVQRGQILFELQGPARAILTGERTALNFLGRMSGIATLTRAFVDEVTGTKTSILDTRKTGPGLRKFDKLAVRHGGGQNHRFGLFDMVLIKDNHIDYAGSLSTAVESARAQVRNLEIEVETRTIEDVQVALDLGVQRILLDNMPLSDLSKAVALNAGRVKLEASGNVTLANVRAIAETGVDYISVGALTHSAKTFDVSLLLVTEDYSAGSRGRDNGSST